MDHSTEHRSADRLRSAALIAVVAGALGSLGFLIRAGLRTPPFLLVIMLVWVLSPFVVLGLADLKAKRWLASTRSALHVVMLLVTVGSLAVYWRDVVRPRKSQPAFVYVAVPPAAWLLIAIVVPAAALNARRRSRRADDA